MLFKSKFEQHNTTNPLNTSNTYDKHLNALYSKLKAYMSERYFHCLTYVGMSTFLQQKLSDTVQRLAAAVEYCLVSIPYNPKLIHYI